LYFEELDEITEDNDKNEDDNLNKDNSQILNQQNQLTSQNKSFLPPSQYGFPGQMNRQFIPPIPPFTHSSTQAFLPFQNQLSNPYAQQNQSNQFQTPGLFSMNNPLIPGGIPQYFHQTAQPGFIQPPFYPQNSQHFMQQFPNTPYINQYSSIHPSFPLQIPTSFQPQTQLQGINSSPSSLPASTDNSINPPTEESHQDMQPKKKYRKRKNPDREDEKVNGEVADEYKSDNSDEDYSHSESSDSESMEKENENISNFKADINEGNTTNEKNENDPSEQNASFQYPPYPYNFNLQQQFSYPNFPNRYFYLFFFF
jgi:hypothetical protein